MELTLKGDAEEVSEFLRSTVRPESPPAFCTPWTDPAPIGADGRKGGDGIPFGSLGNRVEYTDGMLKGPSCSMDAGGKG